MRNILMLICITFLVSCRAAKEEVDTSVVISMQKTKCIDACPVYTIDIYESGVVYFNGRENVDKLGEFKIKLSKKELQRLINIFNDYKFFNFQDRYVSDAKDLPTTYIYFSHNGRRKRVMDYDGAPQTLKKLENEVAQLIKIPKWKQMRKSN